MHTESKRKRWLNLRHTGVGAEINLHTAYYVEIPPNGTLEKLVGSEIIRKRSAGGRSWG